MAILYFSISNIELNDMQQGYFLNLACEINIEYRQQRHATLVFLKNDMGHWDHLLYLLTYI